MGSNMETVCAKEEGSRIAPRGSIRTNLAAKRNDLAGIMLYEERRNWDLRAGNTGKYGN